MRYSPTLAHRPTTIRRGASIGAVPTPTNRRGRFPASNFGFGSDLHPRRSEVADRYRPVIADRAIIVSFATVAELEYGAATAGWGERKLTELRAHVAGARVVWPGRGLLDVYVRLRATCRAAGHGLAERAREADRWIAATALFLDIPLVTDDRVFLDAPGLDVVTLASTED